LGINAFAVGEFGFHAQLFATPTGVYFTSGALISGSFRSLAHGAGRFVAVGNEVSGASTNGRDWTASLNPSSANAVAYGNGRFVAVGGTVVNSPETNRISHSTDGLNWQPSTPVSINRTLHSVVFGSGTFVASGAQGVIVKSTDGITWTAPTNILASDQENILSLAHNGGIFVGVGGSGSSSQIISSTDGGVTFVSRSIPGFPAPIAAVTYGNGRFVAVGPNGYSLTSTDGVNFSRFQIPLAQSSTGATPVFTAIVFADGVFIATTARGQAYTSTDGATWVQSFTGVSAAFSGSVVANGLAMFVGRGKIVGLAVVDKSPYITGQPADLALAQGNALNLTAAISGTAPYTYQWLFNGAPLANAGTVSGATSGALAISNVQPSAAGNYQLVVTNADGSRASREAAVTVAPSPVLTFGGWATGFTFPPGESDPEDDPDGDGLKNLLEYLTGSHPLLSGSALVPAGQVQTGTQLGVPADPAKRYFSFTARVRKQRPGITLTPQAGVTMADFSTDGVVQAGAPLGDITAPDFEFITWYYSVAIENSLSGRAFMRLGASM